MTASDYTEMSLTASAGLEGANSIQDRKKRATAMIALKSFPDRQGPITQARVRDLIEFENRLHPIIQNDKKWFFANAERTDAIQFARDMHVLHNFGAATTEQMVLRRAEWAKSDDDPLLQLMVAFSLHHHASSIKWCFFRHETVKPQTWPQLHSMLLFAETNGFAAAPMRLFDSEAQFKTTVQALYLRSLLLDVLNTGSLNMPQIEIADSWLGEWTPFYQLDTEYTANVHTLFVDLDASSGIQLVTGNAAWPSYRYLRMEKLRDQVEVVRSELRVGRPYHGQSVSSEFPVEEHVALLTTVERIYKSLLEAATSHLEERLLVANLVADIHAGFGAVREAVTSAMKQAKEDSTMLRFESVELSLAPQGSDASADGVGGGSIADRWKIHDMSSKGMGMLVERTTGESAQVGQLLAIKPDGEKQWMLGTIVRKLTQRTIGETLLGIELLCFRPMPVMLKPFRNANDAVPDPDGEAIPALYLPGLEQHGRADVLVMPSRDIGLKSVFGMSASGSTYRLRINRVLRKDEDWMSVRYEVLGKD
jgi:cyclic-di-GMP-binding protein